MTDEVTAVTATPVTEEDEVSWDLPTVGWGGSPSKEQIEILMKDLSSTRVATRRQGNRDLSYLEAYDVKATLIRLFGFGGFSAEVTQADIVRIDQAEGGRYTILAQATVRLTIPSLGCVYSESAAASQAGPQIGEVADFAIKTAESDALKRCATYLGTQFGLSLYNNGSRRDVVKFLYEQRQAEMWKEIQAERVPPNDQAREQLQRALGARQADVDPNHDPVHITEG